MKQWVWLLLAVAPLSAQIRMNALDGLASKAKESVEVTLDPDTLKLAVGFLGNKGKDDAQAKAMLEGIKSVTVRAFEFDQAGQYRMEDLEPIQAQLRAPGWSRIINIKDGGDVVEVYTRTDQGKMAGLAVIAAEPKELVVVAIDGNIDLATLAQLGGQFGIPDVSNLIPGAQKANPQPGSRPAPAKGKQE
jgi:hypothetical protein